MLQDAPCTLHGESKACVCECGATATATRSVSPAVSLAVTGSACNPYSTVRCKRFSDGSVSAHSMNDTTMSSVVAVYCKYEPHAGISEQVQGFGMRYSASDPTTPLDTFPGGMNSD